MIRKTLIKHTLFIAGIILTAACSSPAPEKVSKEEKAEVKDPEEERNLLKEYGDYLTGLDTMKEESITLATEKYKELFSKSDQKRCDSAFAVFHNLYERIENRLDYQVYTDPVYSEIPCTSYDDEGNELPADKKILMLEKRMKKHGFRLECWEGFPGVSGERAFIAKHFYQYVSPEMKTFLEGLRKEKDHLLSVDAGISVTEEQYVDRLVWWENFNKKHPDFILSKLAQSIQRYLFTYFLEGMDNTPAINYPTDDTGVEKIELDSYFVKAYDYLNKKYPNSESNALVKPYKMTILKNDNAKRERLIKTYTKRGLMIDFSKDWEEM